MSVLASVAFVVDAVEPVFVRLLFHLPLMCTDDDDDDDDDEEEEEEEEEDDDDDNDDDDGDEGNSDGDFGTDGGISVKE